VTTGDVVLVTGKLVVVVDCDGIVVVGLGATVVEVVTTGGVVVVVV
jgi:hypothetical protein